MVKVNGLAVLGLTAAASLGGGCASSVERFTDTTTLPAKMEVAQDNTVSARGEAIVLVGQDNKAYIQVQNGENVVYYAANANRAAILAASDATNKQGFVALTQPKIIFIKLEETSAQAYGASTEAIFTNGKTANLFVIGRADKDSIVNSLSGGKALFITQPVLVDEKLAPQVKQVLDKRAEEAKKAAEAKKLETEKSAKPQAMSPEALRNLFASRRVRLA
jgi:hypothetical protein